MAVIVAEVTQPSLGVGYEIGRAFDMNKPILCIYRPQQGKCKFEKNMFSINKRILETALFHETVLFINHAKLNFLSYFIVLSAMIRGMDNGNQYMVRDYQKPEELASVFEKFFAKHEESWYIIVSKQTNAKKRGQSIEFY